MESETRFAMLSRSHPEAAERFLAQAQEDADRRFKAYQELALGSSFRRRPESREVKQPCVYILASKRNGTLYIGVTSDLVRRVWEHKQDLVEGFTKRYGVHTLVWYEVHEEMHAAITREKAIKEWKRGRKLKLIEQVNPDWRGLYGDLV
jgi:putative endonuclease